MTGLPRVKYQQHALLLMANRAFKAVDGGGLLLPPGHLVKAGVEQLRM